MKSHSDFIPPWRETPPEAKSYRSIFKWGAPGTYKHPNNRLYAMVKEVFGLTDEYFKKPISLGDEPVKCDRKTRLSRKQLARLVSIAGEENVSTDGYDRVKYSSGKTMEEAIRQRSGDAGTVSDAVVHPRNKEEVAEIVKFCNRERVPLYVYGGGSSVTLGLKPAKGGITLVMSTHMNRMISLNETNQTATVQAGMMGPDYECALSRAPELYGTRLRYTCGHFPQSFEYSSVGGWIVTLGSGQASTYYGDACDLVISQEYVTPRGVIKTLDYPATATGPKLNDIMKGSEGTFGILVEVTLKIFRYMPENKQRFAFIFHTWEDAVRASREIMQSEFGMPAVFRISDPEETDIGLKLYGIEGTVIDSMIKARGYKPMSRCLLLGSAEGERTFAKNIKKNVKRICRGHGAMYISGYPVSQWEHGRYLDPYMREDLGDYGIVIDTLETGVTWDNLHKVHSGVREFVKSRPETVCMTHASHFYPQGTNLYFIFIGKMDGVKEYLAFQEGIIDAIHRTGGSLSHHHGVGKMISPWMEAHLGSEQMNVLRTLKKHFDPNNILNPGGQLGLDLPPKARRGTR